MKDGDARQGATWDARGAHAQTTQVYRDLTGAAPTSFEAFAAANAQIWSPAG